MYRPSTALQNSFGLKRKGEKKQIQEEVSMYEDASDDDDLEEIAEEDELGEDLADEEVKLADKRLGEIDAKILEKTNLLQQKKQGEENKEKGGGDSSDEGLEAFMNEENESEEEQVEERSPKEE